MFNWSQHMRVILAGDQETAKGDQETEKPLP